MSNSKPHVLIAGAGIGGLSAALALLQRGFSVDVYEQATKLEEVGAGVQLSPNATRALHSMEVLAALEQLSCTAEGKEVRHWKTGETWKLFDLGAEAIERYGFPYLTVWRPICSTCSLPGCAARSQMRSISIHVVSGLPARESG